MPRILLVSKLGLDPAGGKPFAPWKHKFEDDSSLLLQEISEVAIAGSKIFHFMANLDGSKMAAEQRAHAFEQRDMIPERRTGRYVCATESIWRLLGYVSYNSYPSVEHVSIGPL